MIRRSFRYGDGCIYLDFLTRFIFGPEAGLSILDAPFVWFEEMCECDVDGKLE
jgi:hypothetical protein